MALWFSIGFILALAVSQLRSVLNRERTLSAQLAESLGQVKQLRGPLPICASCKKIRIKA